jgi:hypothetical protein
VGVREGHDVLNWIKENREVCSNILITFFVAVMAVVAFVAEPAVKAISVAPSQPTCPLAGTVTAKGISSVRDRVANAKYALTIIVGRSGAGEHRESSPLAIQNGLKKFTAGSVLCTAASDFVRSDGQLLPAGQVTSQALVSNDGQDVTVRVWVAPRYGIVSGFGSYSGTVSIDDSRAVGAEVPVKIDVQYPYINRVLICGLLLAWAGLIWGLLVRRADRDLNSPDKYEPFFANLALRVAVLATAVPIVNAQVLSDPSWTGSLSQYIRLGGLVGAAAIAATPSLRAIVSRARRQPAAGDG